MLIIYIFLVILKENEMEILICNWDEMEIVYVLRKPFDRRYIAWLLLATKRPLCTDDLT
jgi:hypothetical protein